MIHPRRYGTRGAPAVALALIVVSGAGCSPAPVRPGSPSALTLSPSSLGERE